MLAALKRLPMWGSYVWRACMGVSHLLWGPVLGRGVWVEAGGVSAAHAVTLLLQLFLDDGLLEDALRVDGQFLWGRYAGERWPHSGRAS